MQIAVAVQPLNGSGFRAATFLPLTLAAEGSTREEALERLRTELHKQMLEGMEIVHLEVKQPLIPRHPWPDDEITHPWLEGIEEARRAADARPDPWDDETPGQP